MTGRGGDGEGRYRFRTGYSSPNVGGVLESLSATSGITPKSVPLLAETDAVLVP